MLKSKTRKLAIKLIDKTVDIVANRMKLKAILYYSEKYSARFKDVNCEFFASLAKHLEKYGELSEKQEDIIQQQYTKIKHSLDTHLMLDRILMYCDQNPSFKGKFFESLDSWREVTGRLSPSQSEAIWKSYDRLHLGKMPTMNDFDL